LCEKHIPAFNVNGMSWYYGGGHDSFHNDNYYRDYYDRKVYYAAGSLGLGVDGIVGLEYKIPPIPFAISLDIKPFVEINSAGGVGMAMDIDLGIKLTF
jgi:hypothetical protein